MSTSHDSSLPLPQRLGASHYQQNLLLKTLRSVEHGLRARLRSIEHDSYNVLRLYADLFPDPAKGLPLYGNSRAGSWYVPPVVNSVKTNTCSFKSADGHYGQWSSSFRRPNIHVLNDALVNGGAVLVDVTRRGKRWPDSFAKTVPIWCAVINIVTGLGRCQCDPSASGIGEVCSQCASLHLHPDVPRSEREQIRARLPHWVEHWQKAGFSLDQVVPALSEACRSMKPLRPLWVRVDHPGWVDGLPLADLAFTPIVCISASRVVAPADRSYIEPRTSPETILDVTFANCESGSPYVQGAGDDEEAWSLGLNPAMMWEHRAALMEIADMSSQGKTTGQVEEALRSKIRELVARKLELRVESSSETVPSVLTVPVWRSRVFLTCARGDSLSRIVEQCTAKFGRVIVLGEPRPSEGEIEENVSNTESSATGQTSAAWFPLRDWKGKVDHKYGFGRALGPCLSLLRKCCVDNKDEALICCTTKDGDWGAGLAIAWAAWHCKLLPSEEESTKTVDKSKPSPGYTIIGERKTQVGEISKTHIHNTMLHFLSAYPQFQLSRATLKQLNRFFSSPNPSSSISEDIGP